MHVHAGTTFSEKVKKAATSLKSDGRNEILRQLQNEDVAYERLFFAAMATSPTVFETFYTSWECQTSLQGSVAAGDENIRVYGQSGASHQSSQLSTIGALYSYLQSRSFLSGCPKTAQQAIFDRCHEVTEVQSATTLISTPIADLILACVCAINIRC
jgi:hypothetical protein